MKRTVTVLQDDIDNGSPLSSQGCPIAIAAKRDLADLLREYEDCWVTVTQQFLTVYRTTSQHEYRIVHTAHMPVLASSFIACFDAELPVEPFKFEVELGPLAGEYIS